MLTHNKNSMASLKSQFSESQRVQFVYHVYISILVKIKQY